MDKYTVSYTPSASMLGFALKRETLPAKEFFSAVNPGGDLSFSDMEVEQISKHFEQTRIFSRSKASKEAVLSQSPKAHIVHFSCHGNFQVSSPMDSRLVLAEKNKVSFTKAEYRAFVQKFPRAAAYLQSHAEEADGKIWIDTDNADRKKMEDGAFDEITAKAQDSLTLREIFATLRIPRANAVVLSACETGMVELERGDEYVGLASGFLFAGANSVFSSLWAVSDFSTSLLMQKFYDNVFRKNKAGAESLKDAQQYVRDISREELIQELEKVIPVKAQREHVLKGIPQDEFPFAHPYHWGAFVCSGNWE